MKPIFELPDPKVRFIGDVLVRAQSMFYELMVAGNIGRDWESVFTHLEAVPFDDALPPLRSAFKKKPPRQLACAVVGPGGRYVVEDAHSFDEQA